MSIKTPQKPYIFREMGGLYVSIYFLEILHEDQISFHAKSKTIILKYKDMTPV